MYNPETKRVVESRDIVWAEWHGNQSIPSSLKMFTSDVDTKDDQILEDGVGQWQAPVCDDEDYTGAGRKEVVSTPASPVGPSLQRVQQMRQAAESSKPSRTEREIAKLNTFYNPIKFYRNGSISRNFNLGQSLLS
jgi:hypothetical protein